MARRYARDPQTDRSLRHSVRDGVAVSVQSGGGENYFNAFALHLKATTGEIALLAALPPLVGSLAQLFSAWFGRHFGNRRQMILFGVRLQAFTWPFFIFLPVLSPDSAVTLFLACAIIYYASGALVSPHWSSLMGDLVPERKRGRYFALRNRLSSMTSFVALVAGGVVLHLLDDGGAVYIGFMMIFMAAACGRLVSIWHLAQMHDPGLVTLSDGGERAGSWWQQVRQSRQTRFSIFFATMQFSVAIASPFFAVYMLRDLHFTYLQFMANTAASVLTQFLSLSLWGRLGDRFGHRFVLSVTGFLIPLIPALWLFSSHPAYLLLAQVFSGAMWAGFSLSAGNFLYDLVPPHKRVTCMAYHNVLANIGIFAGALVGGWAALHMPSEVRFASMEIHLPSAILGLFFLSFLARLMTAALFLPRLSEVRAVHPVAWGPVVAASLVPFRGFAFDVMVRLRAIAMFVR